VFSGERIKAEEAARLGLIRNPMQQDSFFTDARAIATKIAGNSLSAVISAKVLINEFEETAGIHPKVDAEIHRFSGLFGTADQREGMEAFAGKRAPRFRGL
jgi:enoyl-CoA hydratase